MVSTGVNYNKLKTNLRLAVNRLKMLEKKKTELAQKARKEIGEYISAGKYERAKIRVEHIIREDYVVEAMELVEMYCDLLLARFGLIQQMKTLDDGLAEAISSLIWVTPRLQTDVQELKVISDLLTYKYGKQYAQACRENALKSVNEKLMIKMGVQAPPKILVEKYLIEIAKSLNISYEPDTEVMRDDEVYCADSCTDRCLIDLGSEAAHHNFYGPGGPGNPGGSGGVGGGGGGGGGGMGACCNPQYPPVLPSVPPSGSYAGKNMQPIGFNVEPPNNQQYTKPYPSEPGSFSAPVNPMDHAPAPPPNYETAISGEAGSKSVNIIPKVSPNDKPTPITRNVRNVNDFPELPAVPTNNLPDVPNSSSSAANTSKNDNIDFEDLTKRFEELKKRK